MGWDAKQRGPQKGYYYRWCRVDGVLKKQYVGRDRVGEMAALLDEQVREQRRAARLEVLQERQALALADLALEQSRGLTNLLATAVLVLAGYRQHRGEWRRRREQAEGPDQGR
jgi:hypothetical protein